LTDIKANFGLRRFNAFGKMKNAGMRLAIRKTWAAKGKSGASADAICEEEKMSS